MKKFSRNKIITVFLAQLVIYSVIINLSLYFALLENSYTLRFNLLMLIVMVFVLMLILAFISLQRNFLILDLRRLIFSCENDDNLNDLIRHYNSALKKLKYAKLLLPFGKNKKMLKTYSFELSNQKQSYIM